MGKDKAQLGNRLGPRVAKVVADAHAAQQHRLGPHKRRLFMQMQEDFFHLTGEEQKATLGPLWESLAEHPDADEWVRRTFDFLAHGHGQWQTLLAHGIAGQALTVGLGSLINNAMAPVITDIIAQSPRGLLDPSTLAVARERGYISEKDAYYFAARNGLNASMFGVLADTSTTELQPGVALDLLNRGLIDQPEAERILQLTGMRGDRRELFLQTRRQILSPGVAADAVIRGIISEAEGAKIAAANGMEAQDFATLTLDTGEAPALQTLLEAYRRGFIDDVRLEHGVRTGRLRNEWIDVAKQLRYEPPGPAEAIRAAVQGHLPESEAKSKAEQAGLDPANFDWLFQTAGEPIATGQAIELWRRGKLGQTEVEQVVRESRIKTKYVPAVLELKRHLLPERTVASMVGKGALTAAQATERLRWLGVADDDIAALISEHSATRTASTRELSQATVLELFADKAITEAQTRKHLAAMGYTDADVTLILSLAALRSQRRAQLAAVAVVRAKYVSHHLTDDEAQAQLAALAVPDAEAQQLFALWGEERAANRRLPTVAELTAAFKAQVIDATGWVARILQLGYSQDDVPIMLAAHKIAEA